MFSVCDVVLSFEAGFQICILNSLGELQSPTFLDSTPLSFPSGCHQTSQQRSDQCCTCTTTDVNNTTIGVKRHNGLTVGFSYTTRQNLARRPDVGWLTHVSIYDLTSMYKTADRCCAEMSRQIIPDALCCCVPLVSKRRSGCLETAPKGMVASASIES
jgi:hypothetical protein